MNTTTRFNGTLKKWNAERGFGFVVAEHGEQELFVHATAFPRHGKPPVLGELLTFEVEIDREGRKRAVNVRRPGDPAPGAPRRQPDTARRRTHRPHHRTGSGLGSLVRRVVGLLLVAGLGWYGYTQYTGQAQNLGAAVQGVMSQTPVSAPDTTPTNFRCDGRKHCSQMSSCSEAKRFLENCPGMEMDGDHDGIPCEQQLCTGLFGG